VSADIDERTLREIYLRNFQIAIREANPWSVMSAYNKINDVYASENRWLLTDLLRGEWDYDGVVVSDWGAVHDPVKAVEAGTDLRMPGRPEDHRLRVARSCRTARPPGAGPRRPTARAVGRADHTRHCSRPSRRP
jgi:beta-glucosidase